MEKEVKLSVLKTQVEGGMKKAELAKYYELSETQVSKLLKKANLKIRKFHADKFNLVDDTQEIVAEVKEGVVQLNDENSTEITDTTIENF